MKDEWPRPQPSSAVQRIVEFADLGLRNGHVVSVWGGGLKGDAATWIGYEPETDVLSVDTGRRMVHMPGSHLRRVEVDRP
jgi:hypothetical protein